MLTFALEPWDTYFRDCQALWPEHYEELAIDKDRMPMRPDVATYAALEAAGRLQIVVAREDGRMVGYILSVIRPHLHYADVLCGYEDAYFLAKSHRRGLAGLQLIREAVRHMQAAGARKAFFMCKTRYELNMTPLFERLGFENTDLVFSKWIGDR